MNIASTYIRCAAAITVLGVSSFISASYNASAAAPILAVIGLPAAVLAWWLSARSRFLLPRWLVNGLLSLALAYAILRTVSGGVQVETIAELVVFIQIIKIGDRRAPRDDAQILSLAVFLAIAAMLTSNSFWVGVQLVVFIPLLIATVMLFQIRATQAAYSAQSESGTFAAEPSPLSPLSPPPLLSRPGDPRLVRQLRATIGFATALAVLMSVVVFIIMPRGIGENALGRWTVRGIGNATGFTDHVKLGDRSIISLSQKIVMEVTIRSTGLPESDPAANLGSSETVYYLRGAVLDLYKNGAWTADPSHENDYLVIPGNNDTAIPDEIPIGPGPQTSSTIEQRFTIHSLAPNAPLFAIWRPVKLEGVAHGNRHIRIEKSFRTIDRDGLAGPVQYTVISAMNEPYTAAEERTPTSFSSPRIHDLAARILRDGGIEPDPAKRPISDDSRAARSIEGYLRTHYSYTLVEQPVAYGTDPIENFLFNTKAGHCEYFASAMAALCRSIGVNARIVAGYVAAEFNAATGCYIIRDANAHAWIEAEAGRNNWRRFDPTPPADLVRIHRPPTGLFGRLRHAVESAEYAWNSSVVSFDEGARQRLLGPEDESRPGFLTRLDRLSENIRYAGPRHFVRSAAIGIAVFLGVAGLGLTLQVLFAVLPRLRWRPVRVFLLRGAPPSGAAAQLRLYRRLLNALARRGHAKPDWRPPLAHAETISDAPLSAATTRLASLYYRLRFGGRPLSDTELSEATQLLNTIERASS